MKILIAGGGIGGLTAALCLAEQHHDVQVFEQSAQLEEIGAGIQLSPNATRVLHNLGLEQDLRQTAFLPEGTEFRDWRTGRVIASQALGEQTIQQYGFPYYHIHRGDLLSTLATAAARHPGITVHTCHAVTAIVASQPRVQLTAGDQLHCGDLLIGADGIHSRVRATLWGTTPANFTGNVAWRVMIPKAALPPGRIHPVSSVWWGPGKHFVHYFIKRGEWLNCVCVVEKSGWEIESWTQPGNLSELKADFAGWHPDIQMLLDLADSDRLFKWALFDRPAMPQWRRGHVTLLGDACHPTLPFMAQGAAMAIEDAAVLATCLNAAGDTVSRLQRYETLRRPRTSWVQKSSRRNARVFHLAGFSAWLRNRAAGKAGQQSMANLYRYDALNVDTQSTH